MPRKASKENCLAVLRQDLLKEWDYNSNEITPYDVTVSSAKRIWWICSNENCKHKYAAKIYHRTNGSGCPACAGQVVTKNNCLANLRPDLAAEWHAEFNVLDNPYTVTCGVGRKFWWKCSRCKYEWKSTINNRAGSDNGCPACAGRVATVDNCLATKRPDIASEWNSFRNKETPYTVTSKSNKIVWWKCKRGHEWKAQICNRISNGSNCPECYVYYHEELCRCIMKEIFNKEFVKCRPGKTLMNKRTLQLDCYNEELKINVEYDGRQHSEYPNCFHKTKEQFELQCENDRIKDQWCKDNCILQIRVSYKYRTKEDIRNYIESKLFSWENTARLYNKVFNP